jgi:hypothetical protein
MDISRFVLSHPFLYHLTDQRNFEYLRSNGGLLLCTTELVEKCNLLDDQAEKITRERRPLHTKIRIEEHDIFIRDQKPISLRNLNKCLTDHWSYQDFLFHLNSRVFFWPTTQRLTRHYNRYVNEKPLIIRVSSTELFSINPEPEFCRLNSGATRSSSHYNGAPPPRGINTFLSAENYPFGNASVAEVTFRSFCQLPPEVTLGNSPWGPWNNCVI